MEAMDNPSYFTLPGSRVASLRAAGGRILRIMGAASSASSGCGPRAHSAPATPTAEAAPPPAARRPLRFLMGARGRGEGRRAAEGRSPSAPCTTAPCTTGHSDIADDMVYYNLPAPPPQEREAPFRDDGDAAYYNVCAGRRRHSIGGPPVSRGAAREEVGRGEGTWGARRRVVGVGHRGGEATASVAEAASRRQHAHRRCHRCTAKAASRKNAADLDDILIISSHQSQVADLWVTYLNSCFEQISKQRNCPSFRLLNVCLEDFGTSIPVVLEEKMAGVRLQVVIICPLFLDYLFQHPEPGSAVGRLLSPEKVIAMLLGVEESNIKEEHRAALISYNQWKHLQVKNKDTKFVADFLNMAMGILSHASAILPTRPEKALFSVMPKKVKEGHSKVIVLLTEPLGKEDEICITIDKSGEVLEVTSIKRRNLYTVTFAMPATCLEISMLVGVNVIKNGKALGCRQVKCESRMRELDQILRSLDNPLEFMCQTLGFSPGDREQLDSFLLAAFQRNLPPHFNLLNATTSSPHHRPYSRSEEYPTLLHFSARFGLEKLAWQLLECPGGEIACDLRNVCELTPAEMAEKAGHTKLANSLRGYLQMSEFSSMYSYLKMVCQNQNNTPENLCETDYHKPRPLSETYQVPPSARPLVVLGPQPSALQISQNTVLNGYMEMHPTGNGHSPTTDNSETEHQYLSFDEPLSPLSDEVQQKLKKSRTKKSQELLFENVQDQLAEIINDFKNNVFTIAEVEKLVENWKNRNDVQQSFVDKQEQLDKMRNEYERIQKKMKDDMRRATPFDRIRQFFKGKGKDTKETSNKSGQSCSKSQNSDVVHQRPSSSLSLQSATSTSSSEQMSLASGCSGASLGDSGTHSDPEDKKASSNGEAQNGNSGTGNDLASHSQSFKAGKAKTFHSYETPPTPRPVQLHLCSHPVRSGTSLPESREIRPPCPVPRNFPPDCSQPNEMDDSSYYTSPLLPKATYGETMHEASRYTKTEVPINKISPSTSKSFSEAQGINENGRYLNVVEERLPDGKVNQYLGDCDQNLPKIPGSPEFSMTCNETELPNYANITCANSPLFQGDVFQLSVPPPIPPRLE